MLDRRLLLKGGLAAATLGSLPLRAFAAPKVNVPFPIFDTHPHFYAPNSAQFPWKADIAANARTKATNDPMTHEVVVRKYWDNAGITMGTGVQYNTVYGTDNSYLLDVAKSDPKRVFPVVILAATDPKTPDTLRKFTRENKIAGVRLFGSPVNGEFEFFQPAAIPAWDAVNELGIAMVLMLVGGDLNKTMGRVKEFAAKYPSMPIVLDHLGYPDPKSNPETFGLTQGHLDVVGMKNLYWKLTNFHLTTRLDPARADLKGFIDYVARLYGTDHMVWGSDIGNTTATIDEHFALLQRQVDATAHFPAAKRKEMFYDTAVKVFVPGGTRRKA